MKEYEIYLPTTHNDGTPADAAAIGRFKVILANAFGGYTHFQQGSEGSWSIGGVTFRDEVTIVRVLDDGKNDFDMPAFKRSLEAALKQQSVLIVAREVSVVL